MATISSFNGEQNCLKPKDDVLPLLSAKAVVVGNDKTLVVNIFFHEGSQSSYKCAGFAEQFCLKPESCKHLSVSGFGVVLNKQHIAFL